MRDKQRDSRRTTPIGAGVRLTPTLYSKPIKDLQLYLRGYTCLKRSGLITVGQVLGKSADELLALRNFGRQSYDNLRQRLDDYGILPRDDDDAV